MITIPLTLVADSRSHLCTLTPAFFAFLGCSCLIDCFADVEAGALDFAVWADVDDCSAHFEKWMECPNYVGCDEVFGKVVG